ncbi:MAG: 50S ribosomal protein L25/general stress protein Ctc [Pseudoclavibacter sp.]|nr:50S ribosomal protein L25/general stress protein Ctc [Pseudoclavibacter sp.]
MADIEKLSAELRTQFGKGAARRIRAADKVPAVLYGHGTEPRHLTLPGHDTMLLIRKANAIVDLAIEGGDKELVLVKDVQRDPVRRVIEHVDLVIVRRNERVEVEVPVHLLGEPEPGMIAMQDTTQLLVSAPAISIPEALELDVEGLAEGTVLHATDVPMPEGVELVDAETEIIVVSITPPRISGGLDADQPEAEAEAVAVEAEAAGEDEE